MPNKLLKGEQRSHLAWASLTIPEHPSSGNNPRSPGVDVSKVHINVKQTLPKEDSGYLGETKMETKVAVFQGLTSTNPCLVT